MHVWSVTCLPKNLDETLLRLAHCDATRLVVTRTPGKQRQTIQYFAETRDEATSIQMELGSGDVAEVSDAWKTALPAHAPIRIRDRFLIVETTGADPREIVIPAGLAFGTGDHPTTASCLRLLCDVAKNLGGKKWSLLDVGTGSGLLAIAARKLGASPVAGFDYDPFSIRTSKENARANAVRGIQWSQQDLLKFAAEFQYDVVAANIFSELFLASWSRIRPTITPGGCFILSGILRFQADDCRAAITQAGFEILREVRLGKWVTFLAEAGK
ncbi:MAG: 50S ribosomal protein L11 methyltransferase [Chthoniobacterales bacterium]